MPLDWARQATAIDDVAWRVSWTDRCESKKKRQVVPGVDGLAKNSKFLRTWGPAIWEPGNLSDSPLDAGS